MSAPPWHALADGEVVEGPSRPVPAELVRAAVELGGFVHPLFTDPEWVERHSPLPVAPLPGTAVLHLLGGLAESSGVLDGSVVALVGFEEVRFLAPTLPGSVLRLGLQRLDVRPTRSGRAVLRVRWTGATESGPVVEAVARMLVQPPQPAP